MPKNNRDDFSAQVKRTLASRVGWHCSNQDCRAATIGPTSIQTGVNNIGKAAHIAAAAPGGPRYDIAMTPSQRRCINNGIWLCSTCADMIDRDPFLYSLKVLHAWKDQAEAFAKDQLGKEPPSARELSVFKAKALGEHVTGTSIAGLITEVHRVGAKEIQRIDPRFSAKIRADSEGTQITLNPVETVECTLSVRGEAALEFLRQMDGLQKHGHKLDIAAQGIAISGTPLLDEALGKPERIVIETHRRFSAIQRVTWVDVRSGSSKSAEINGELVGGTESVTFSGALFDGLYRIKYRTPLGASGKVTVDLEGEVSFVPWEGRSIRRLPHLDRFLSLCEAIFHGQEIHSSADVDGHEWFSDTTLSLIDAVELREAFFFLRYVSRIRDILEVTKAEATFHNTPVSEEDSRAINEYWSWACRIVSLSGSEIGTISSELVPRLGHDTEAIKQALAGETINAIEFQLTPYGSINVFGKAVPVRPLTILLSKVSIRKNRPRASIRVGRPIDVEFVPAEDCRATVTILDKVPSTP